MQQAHAIAMSSFNKSSLDMQMLERECAKSKAAVHALYDQASLGEQVLL